MTWSEQAETMAKVWTDAQKKMWESWFGIAQNTFNPATMFSGGAMFPGGMNFFEQWQKMASQGYETLMGGATPASQSLSRQFVAAQQTMMRMLEMTTRAWNIMMPKLEAGEDWQTVLSSYMEEFRKQMLPNAAMMNQATTGTANMWQNYMQYLQSVAQPWLKVFQHAPGHIGAAMAGNGSSELLELTNMFWNTYDQTVGNFTSMPGVGFTRELEEKLARGFQAWKKAVQAMNDYNLLIGEAFAGIQEQVLREMMSRAEQGKPVESVRDLVRLWTTAADKSFDNVFRTDKYSQVQGAFVQTYMEYRIEEQRIVDELMKYSPIPTRTELDEAHRNIYELRKEVKALKKALKENGASSSSSSGSSTKKSTRKSSPAPATEKPAAPAAEKPDTAPAPASEK